MRYAALEAGLKDNKEAISSIYNRMWGIAGTIILLLIGGFSTLFLKLADAGKHLVN